MEERPGNGDRGVERMKVYEEDAGNDDPRISLIEILVAGVRDDPEELGEKNDPVDRIDASESLPREGWKCVGFADVVPVSGENDDAAENEEILYAKASCIEGKSARQEGRVMHDNEYRRHRTTGL